MLSNDKKIELEKLKSGIQLVLDDFANFTLENPTITSEELLFLSEVKNILNPTNSSAEGEAIIEKLKNKLAARKIVSSTNEPFINPLSPINLICLQMAAIIDRDNMTIPAIPSIDSTQRTVNKLLPSQFLVRKSDNQVLDLESFFETIFKNSAKNNEDDYFKKLTTEEKKYLVELLPLSKLFFGLTKKVNSPGAEEETLKKLLEDLLKALLKGSTRTSSSYDYDAGPVANEGIVKFKEQYDLLDTDTIQFLHKLGKGRDNIAYIVNKLFKSMESAKDGSIYGPDSALYCINELSYGLERVIKENVTTLSGKSVIVSQLKKTKNDLKNVLNKPVMFAIASKQYTSARLLIKNNAHQCDKTLLIWAIESNAPPDIVLNLIDLGIHQNVTDSQEKKLLLDWAIKHAPLKMVSRFIELGAPVDQDEMEMAIYSNRSDKADLTSLLLKKNSNLLKNIDCRTAIQKLPLAMVLLIAKRNSGFNRNDLSEAISANRLDVVQSIFNATPHLFSQKDTSDKTPLILAIEAQHIDIVKFLLEKNPKYLTAEAFDLALSKHHPEMVNLLLKAGYIITTAYVLDMVKANQLEKLKIIIKLQPDLINCKDKLGQTPLIWASIKGHQTIVEFLLSHDHLELNAKTETLENESINGNSALDYAIDNKHIEIIKQLKTNTPFKMAKYKKALEMGQDDMVSALAQPGQIRLEDIIEYIKNSQLDLLKNALTTNPAVIESPNEKGQTQLMQAVIAGNAARLDELLKLGRDLDALGLGERKPDVHAKSKEGKTAMDYALERTLQPLSDEQYQTTTNMANALFNAGSTISPYYTFKKSKDNGSKTKKNGAAEFIKNSEVAEFITLPDKCGPIEYILDEPKFFGLFKTAYAHNHRNADKTAALLMKINALAVYLNTECNRLGKNGIQSPKYQALKEIHDGLHTCTTEYLYSKKLQEVREIAHEHQHKGWSGFFRGNWARDTTSYKHFNQQLGEEVVKANLHVTAPLKPTVKALFKKGTLK